MAEFIGVESEQKVLEVLRPQVQVIEVNRGQKGDTGETGLAVDLGVVNTTINLTPYKLNSQTFRLTTGSGTLSIAPSNMPVMDSGQTGVFSLRITQGATPRAITINSAIKASFGIKPTLSTTAGAVDIWTFMYTGVEWIVAVTATAVA